MRGERITSRTRIAKILESLIDGRWHSIKDLKDKAKLSDSQFNALAKFLYSYDFIKVDDAEKKVKLEEAVRKFLDGRATS